MGFDKDKDGEEEVHKTEEEEERNRQMSQASLDVTDQEDDEEEDEERTIELGPQRTLKEQVEKDKEDESLRRWKEQLLGSVDLNSVGETLDPDVKILSLSINSPGRDAIVLPIPEAGNHKGLLFTLKENSRYCLEFSFKVSNNIVSGLKYTNTVWKTAVKAQKRCLGLSVHRRSLINMKCLKKLHLRVYLVEDHIQQKQSFWMTITSVT